MLQLMKSLSLKHCEFRPHRVEQVKSMDCGINKRFKSQFWPLGVVENWAHHGLSTPGLCFQNGVGYNNALRGPGRGAGTTCVNCVTLSKYDLLPDSNVQCGGPPGAAP